MDSNDLHNFGVDLANIIDGSALDRRTYLAGQALAGLLSDPETGVTEGTTFGWAAVQHADATIAALDAPVVEPTCETCEDWTQLSPESRDGACTILDIETKRGFGCTAHSAR